MNEIFQQLKSDENYKLIDVFHPKLTAYVQQKEKLETQQDLKEFCILFKEEAIDNLFSYAKILKETIEHIVNYFEIKDKLRLEPIQISVKVKELFVLLPETIQDEILTWNLDKEKKKRGLK